MAKMEGSTIPVEPDTLIIIRTSADLFLSGGDQSEVRLFGSGERVQIQQEGKILRIENHSGMDLMVPRGANVKVERVGGSALLQDLGVLEVEKVGGELSVQRVAQVEIGKVGGDLMAREVGGAFRVQRVGGDLIARELGGPVTVEQAGGDGDVQAVGMEEFILRAGGDATIYLTRSTGRLVSLRAGGDVMFYLPPEPDARFEVAADGENIHLQLNHQPEPFDSEFEQRRYEFVMGEGEGRVEIRCGGNCHITDEAGEPSSLSSEFERLETSWENARENRTRFGFPGHFDPERSSAWAEMVGRRAQEAARRAEMRAQSAVRRAEEQARRASERAERQGFPFEEFGKEFGKEFGANFGFPGFPGGPGNPPRPPRPSQPQVSEQERMMVLKMLQEGKISVEQAEALLRALEGKYKE